MVPGFMIAMVYHRYDYALYLFAAAAITDKLDGAIARLTGKSTPLGAFLDPLADKLMLLAASLAFFFSHLIPAWFAIFIISRDIIIMVGWSLLTFTGHTLRIDPTRLGKLAVAALFTLFAVILVEVNFDVLQNLKSALIWLTAALTVVSGIQYIQKGLSTVSDKEDGD
jgi:cardiolipin synthase